MQKSPGKGLNNSGVLVELATSKQDVPIPSYIQLKPEAADLWPIYTRVRLKDEWREFDLILLAKICNIEADIRHHQEMLDKTGIIITNRRGTPIENPLLRVIDLLTRQQMTIIRALSMNTTAGDPRTGSAQSSYSRKMQQVIDGDIDGLLSPAH